MAVFFTADSHFGHANIIKYTNRPFDSVHDMNKALVANWNHVVSPHDSIYILGDFAFSNHVRYASRLNGKKYLILGNHDKRKDVRIAVEQGFFEWAKEYHELKLPDSPMIVLCHYSMRVWNKKHHGSYHLFGHSHGNIEPFERSFDVGVDVWGYTPISLEKVKEVIADLEKDIKSWDHTSYNRDHHDHDKEVYAKWKEGKMHKYICPHCKEGFTDTEFLRQPKKDKRKCPKCGNIITTEDFWRGFDLAAE